MGEVIMTKKSPLARVKDEHGTKADLAKKVLAFLPAPEDDDEAKAFAHRVETMSNRKLLRLFDAQQLLTKKFGSKDALVEAITKARFPGGNADYARKLSSFTTPKLLDIGRQHGLVRNSELPTL
jgi:hypothetical protein